MAVSWVSFLLIAPYQTEVAFCLVSPRGPFLKTVRSIELECMDINAKNQSLIKACQERDIEEICNLIELGANPNAKDEFGDSPLHLLANSHGTVFSELDFVPALRALLDAGAKIDQKSRSEGLTPLHHAVDSGNENISLFLIERGADVNAKDRKSNSVLTEGLNRGTEKIVFELLKNGASADYISKAGRHPMSYLPNNASNELIQRLVVHGADPKDDSSYCLVRMIECKNWEAARELVRLGANPNAVQDTDGETHSMRLSGFGRSEEACQKLRYLVSLGADIHLTNNAGQTCLDIATLANNSLMIECITLILEES
jgi:ankyrin repeat protein